MNSRHSNLRQTWLRRLAAFVAMALLISMLPVAALAEDADNTRSKLWDRITAGQKPDDPDKSLGDNDPDDDSLDGEEPEFELVYDDEEDDGVDDDDDDDAAPGPEGDDDDPEASSDDDAGDDDAAPDADAFIPDLEDPTVILTAFTELPEAEFSFAVKPELETLLESFPGTLTATIENVEEEVVFNVTWFCEDYELRDGGAFTFYPRFIDETVMIGERETAIGDVLLDIDVFLPAITVNVDIVTGLEALDADTRVLMYKPETAEQAAQALELPEVITGTLNDAEETREFPVNWVCEDYDGEDVLAFTFRAEFADEPYALAEGVEMPAVEARVASVAAFEALDKTEFFVIGKPESVKAAVKRMGLPDTVCGLPSGFIEDTTYDITWTCPDYDDSANGEYTFVAQFAGTRYALEDGVEMPSVILKVAEKVASKSTADFTYVIEDGKAIINGYHGSDTTLVIDDEIEDCPVTTIAENVFKDNTTLTSVTLPKGLITVGAGAFANCAKLTKVVFHDKLAQVADDAFTTTEIEDLVLIAVNDGTKLSTYCGDDSTVNLPENVTDIEIHNGLLFDCDFTLDAGHTINVVSGEAKNDNRTLTNYGTITVAEGATFTNNGTIYSCAVSSKIEGTINKAAITSHSFELEEGDKYCCEHCTLTLSLKDDATTQAHLTKEYDGTTDSALVKGDFEVIDSQTNTAAQISDTVKVEVTSVTAEYDDADVGDKKTITAVIKLTNDENEYPLEFTGAITKKNINDSDVEPTPIEPQTYDGGAIEPDITLTFNGTVLGEDDFIAEYSNNVNAGTATVTITGVGNFTGVLEDVPFTIKPCDIGEAEINAIDRQQYTGSPIKPVVCLSFNGIDLVEEEDFTVAYSNNKNVGTATVTITGTGNFTGKTTTNFEIYQGKKKNVELTATYNGDAITKVYDGTRKIKPQLEKEDFTINNVPDGEDDAVEITGITAYYDSIHQGTRKVTVKFAISQNSAINNYTLKDLTLPGTITKKPLIITPEAGQTKQSGQPYFISYEVDGLLSVDEITGELAPKSEDVGTQPIVQGTLAIKNIEEGKETSDYDITLAPATITISRKSIEDTDVVVDPIADQSYTGYAIKPDTTVLAYAALGSTKYYRLVEGTDYTVSYKDNIQVSTDTKKAVATITAKNNFAGTRTVEFKIVPKNIADKEIKVGSIAQQTYTGSALTPAVTITYTTDQGTKTLVKDTDYTLEYTNNTSAGTATVTIKGKGNFTGSRTTTFKIVKSGSSGGSSSSGGDPDEPEPAEPVGDLVSYISTDGNYGLVVDEENGVMYFVFLNTGDVVKGHYIGSVGGFFGWSPDNPFLSWMDEYGCALDFSGSPFPDRLMFGDIEMVRIDVDSGDDRMKDYTDLTTIETNAAAEVDDTSLYTLFGYTLTIDDEDLGSVVYDENYMPLAFDHSEDESDEPAPDDQMPDAPRRRLTIKALPEKSESGETQYLDAAKTREKFASMHLRLTNEQIEKLKEMGFVEVVFEYDQTSVRLPLDALTDEIDLNKTVPPEATEEGEPAAAPGDENFAGPEGEDVADPEGGDVAGPEDDEFTIDDEQDGPPEPIGPGDEDFEEIQDDKAPLAGEEEYVPVLQVIDMYDLHIEQAENLTRRESNAIGTDEKVTSLYRMEINALEGQFPDMTSESEGEEEELADGDETAPVEQTVATPNDTPVAPSAEEVAKALNFVADVGLTAIDETAEANPAKVFFSLNVLSKSAEFEIAENIIAGGVSGGGLVEIYDTLEDAQAREAVLSAADGSIFSQHHKRIGSCVVRLSERLNERESNMLMEVLTQALTADAPTNQDKTLLYTLPRQFPVMRLLNYDTAAPENDMGDDEWETDDLADEAEAPEPVGNARVRVKPLETRASLPASAKLVFVSGEAEISDEDAVLEEAPSYFPNAVNLDDSYVEFYPLDRGLYGVVIRPNAAAPDEPAQQPEEEEEEEVFESEPESTPEPVATPEPTPTPEPTATPEPLPVDDPEAMYAYNRRSNEGNMYWLIDNTAKTVEFYREDTKTYRIGDFTGSLIGGMEVQFRDDNSMVHIQLKFQQTYKFALTEVDGTELLMEQSAIDDVEGVIKGVRQ